MSSRVLKDEEIDEFIKGRIAIIKFEEFLTFSIVGIIAFWFVYLSAYNQVFGADAWYWLKFGFKKPLYANLVMVLMCFFIFFLFTQAKGKKQNPYFIASLFFLNLFSIRFMEVELDDYLFYVFSLSLVLWLKNLFPKKPYHKLLAIGIVAFYLGIHANLYNPSSLVLSGFETEVRRNPIVFLYLIPTFYLLAENRKHKDLIFLLLYCLIFMKGKWVTNPIPVYAFALYLDFLTGDFKYRRSIVFSIFMFSLGVFLSMPIYSVQANLRAFELYCNPETKICNNTEEEAWFYGHYFAYLGYVSNNPSYFGVHCCSGRECLNFTGEYF